MMAQLSTTFGYVAGAAIFIATIFMLRAILSGPNEKKPDQDDDD